ncbi:MAG: SDR family NAD(P)-dependent oxidoreductase [Pseudomonadota bacterium]
MKNCLIVRAGEGVSRAIARRFGSGGFRVGLISRSCSNLKSLANDLIGAGVEACWETADASDATELPNAITLRTHQMGACDVLLDNAVVLRSGHPRSATAKIAANFEINVFSAHRAVSSVAPAMSERGQGAILFTGGGLALEPFPEWTSLALGKAALRSLAVSLFNELSPKGIHGAVLAICDIVKEVGPFDPDEIAKDYWRVATDPNRQADREVVFQPDGTDPFCNDPERVQAAVSRLPTE